MSSGALASAQKEQEACERQDKRGKERRAGEIDRRIGGREDSKDIRHHERREDHRQCADRGEDALQLALCIFGRLARQYGLQGRDRHCRHGRDGRERQRGPAVGEERQNGKGDDGKAEPCHDGADLAQSLDRDTYEAALEPRP